MDSSALPQEIFLLLCEELAARRDFGTLFNCALVSRRFASIALEQIYSVQEYSPASTGDAVYKLEWLQLWRSIILSSIKKTAYPYCVYVRSLSLGNLEECLQDITRDKNARDIFFGGAMEQFLVLREGQSLFADAEEAQLPPLDTKATIVKCADSITKFIKRLADDTGTAVSLAHLEGTSIPHDILPTWIARLGTLTSLRIRDGSVLGVEAASAIAECCPRFVDLTCFYCSTADDDLAAFFGTLRPNSLRSFEVISQNSIGKKALTALNSHATSLRSLVLRNLTPQAMKALNSFPDCTSLEKLLIENDLYNLVNLTDYPGGMLDEVSAWICKCKSLRDLSFSHFIGSHPVIGDILNSPNIRLTSLSIISIHSGTEPEDTATWTALGFQEHLESLTLGLHDGTANFLMEAKPPLVDSICRLKNMVSLNLMQVHLTEEEVERIAAELPNLSEFSFSGELLEDHALLHLSSIPKLKLLCINSLTRFSFDGLYQFGYWLMDPDRTGIKVDILNQLGDIKFSPSEYDQLQKHFIKHPKGRLEITYFMDPDELHEIDFSDVSD
ncbi:hypothetical protein F4774DRAFT_185553 [Daldinia eschscholtzii]|nr:hypothetical protein F4774DRAFT_185553 [Daldinia eschscholtzii]